MSDKLAQCLRYWYTAIGLHNERIPPSEHWLVRISCSVCKMWPPFCTLWIWEMSIHGPFSTSFFILELICWYWVMDRRREGWNLISARFHHQMSSVKNNNLFNTLIYPSKSSKFAFYLANYSLCSCGTMPGHTKGHKAEIWATFFFFLYICTHNFLFLFFTSKWRVVPNLWLRQLLLN